ncbi:DNA-binding NarL/FixJ family response regulator [Kineococcus xinjiangensis]|uniref:DNA-binding NarL/FixJ family response regulator n=1 Tax=Kineococcus xinjiangensis TaxID=512762 RepID=A0A2S6IDA9_9ACTN|nr:response regulator transcription factor [Kineococcus xinjiangensis]PPK92187.1 DNA-binding NarL/FixJ family response regulator [Kineococcus xinjiangensis]
MIRVVVADDHPVYLDGISAALCEDGEISVVGRGRDGEEAVDLSVRTVPDVVLLDLRMPGTDGVEALRRIRSAVPQVAVLVLTMLEDDQSVRAALRAGARGYLVKGASRERIVRAVRAVADGELVFAGPAAAEVQRTLTTGRADGSARALPQLSDREVEVLDLAARGLGNRVIAQQLFLSEKTVRNHVWSILSKLGVGDRAAAVARARDAGLGTTSAPGTRS